MEKMMVKTVWLIFVITMIVIPVQNVHAQNDSGLYYTVTFRDGNTIIDVQEVAHGEDVVAPQAPAKEGYNFVRWVPDITNIVDDMDIYAVYEKIDTSPKEFTVRFLDFDESVLYTQKVADGEDAIIPQDPVREGYRFTGWRPAITNISSDMDTYAQYEKIEDSPTEYIVYFFDYDDTLLYTQKVVPGGDAIMPLNPVREGYKFVGWRPAITNITSNTNVFAIYEKMEFGEGADEIKQDIIYSSEIEEPGQSVLCYFTPKETGVYGHTISCDYDFYMRIYDETGELLYVSRLKNDSTIQYIYEEGKKYFCELQMYSNENIGSFEMMISKGSMITNIELLQVPDRTLFYYGVESPNIRDLKVRFTTEDGTQGEALALNNIWKAYGMSADMQVRNGGIVEYDEYQNIPVGEYEWVVSAWGNACNLIIPFQVVDPETSVETLRLYEKYSTEITEEGQVVSYRFTPKASGDYCLRIDNDFKHWVWMIEGESEFGTTGWVVEEMEGGKTYYFQLVINDVKNVGKVDVILFRNSGNYTIAYDKNCSEATGIMAKQNMEYASGTRLIANSFNRAGYTFVGWNTKADGTGTMYADKAIGSGFQYEDGVDVILYAQWKRDEYSVEYYLEGGKNNTSNPNTYTVDTNTFNLKKPTRAGYTFAGWYSDSAFKNKVTRISKGSTGDKKFYAKWKANQYTIKFNANGGKGTMTAANGRIYGKTYTLKANAFKRAGYTFKGWNTKKNGSGKSYKDKTSVKNLVAANGKSITLYAQWKKETYKITYKLNGGKNNTNNPKMYTVTSTTKTLKKPTKSGYMFKGWYSDSKFKKKVTKITKGSIGNITLYAKWVKKK